MEATTRTTTDSYKSYLGSVLSLISKSEIRYQGVLLHVDTFNSSIGLQNVRSFGTEGRRNDGHQVLPSDKVYDYIIFRGTDVKDLQILSSTPPQSAPAMPDDPAIISTNYIPPPPPSASLPPIGSWPMTNFGPNIQLGIPGSTFQPMGSWFPSSPQISNDSVQASSPLYWQGYNGPSSVQPTSGSRTQQIPHSITNNGPSASNFFQFPTSLLPSFSTSSLDNTTAVFPPTPSSLKFSVGGSTLLAPGGEHNHFGNIQPTFVPSAKFTPLVSSSSPFLMDTKPAGPPTAYSTNSVFATSSPSQGIFTYMPSSDETSVANPAFASNHAESVKAENLFQSMPSSVPSSHTLQTDQKDIEVVVQASASQSLSIDAKKEHDQAPFSKPDAEKLNGASVHPHLHDKRHEGGKQPQQQEEEGERKQKQQERGVTGGGKKGFHGADSRANRGVSTWHGSKDKFPGADSRGNHGIKTWHTSQDKFNGADPRGNQGIKTWHTSKDKFNIADPRGNKGIKTWHTSKDKLNRADPQGNQGIKTWHASKDKLNGAAAHNHYSNRAHGQGRGKEFYGGAKLSHLSYRSHMKVNVSPQPTFHGSKRHERQNWVSGASSSPNFSSKSLARGKQNGISQPVMKFTEDFDFEAMNKKFNKDKVWGQLGKSCKPESKEGPIGSNGDGQCQEEKIALPKTDTSIYIKDDFFDSLSHGDFKTEPKEGRIKLSDMKKLDQETFGDDVRLNQGARSGMQRGRGGQSGGHGHTGMVKTSDTTRVIRGSHGGRSSTGKVEGRAVWCRVT
ncbi:hypothetical protein ACFE04_005873 [Oxalis oulophora]